MAGRPVADDPTSAELQGYLAREAGTWAVIHGFRYLAFLCIALFAAALFARTCRTRPAGGTGWGIVGFLGAVVFVTNGVVTNGVETLAFLDTPPVNGSRELFFALYGLTRVLFTAEVVTWSMLILGFSVAGWRSGTLPKWISGLGFVQVGAGVTAGVTITSALAGDGIAIPLEVATAAGTAVRRAGGLPAGGLGEYHQRDPGNLPAGILPYAASEHRAPHHHHRGHQRTGPLAAVPSDALC